jgi:tetratricopeptide (TPR) repeat protein
LSQLAAVPAGYPEPARPSSRLFWASAVCGGMALAAWMISIKLPGALAEPHYTAFLMLQHHGAELEEERDEIEDQKLVELLAAARANPKDCRVQLLTSQALLAAFGRRQAASEAPLMLDQIRDAAVASEFDSAAALQEWLEAVTGPNRRYLKAAQQYARRCVRVCPLEGRAYILLGRLEFLRDPANRLEEPLQQQALAVRPYDAMVDFEIGRTLLLKESSGTVVTTPDAVGEVETAADKSQFDLALNHLRKAFQRSPGYQREIAAALAGNFTAAELLERFEPDCAGLGAMVAAFVEAHLEDELPLLREKYAVALIAEAQRLSGWRSEGAWRDAVAMFHQNDEPERAIRTAQAALEHHSQSVELHKILGAILMQQNDFAGAAEELQWAAFRAPDDASLKQLAAEAVKQKLRHEGMADGIEPAGYRY